jgi:hypothetical protein
MAFTHNKHHDIGWLVNARIGIRNTDPNEQNRNSCFPSGDYVGEAGIEHGTARWTHSLLSHHILSEGNTDNVG